MSSQSRWTKIIISLRKQQIKLLSCLRVKAEKEKQLKGGFLNEENAMTTSKQNKAASACSGFHPNLQTQLMQGGSGVAEAQRQRLQISPRGQHQSLGSRAPEAQISTLTYRGFPRSLLTLWVENCIISYTVICCQKYQLLVRVNLGQKKWCQKKNDLLCKEYGLCNVLWNHIQDIYRSKCFFT